MKTLSNTVRRLAFWVSAGLALAAASRTPAYDIIKDQSNVYVVTLDPGTFPLRVMLPASPALSDGTSQSSSFVEAVNAWNSLLGTVQFQTTVLSPGTYQNGNDLNEIVMDNDIDGDAFDENTLAVTMSYHAGNSRVESDIVFNTAYTWESFRGGRLATNTSAHDIRRVAIHELGHVLGLDHPDQASPPQSVNAIMNSRVSYSPAVDTMRSDDIAGAQSLYGAPGFVPSNNNFASAHLISLSNGSAQFTGTNVAATAEPGEPALDSSEPGRRTIWWKWTAPTTGGVIASTLGSNFDTLLGAYTGSAVNALTQIALNDDEELPVQGVDNPNRKRTSRVTFTAAAGTTYYFAVDGWGGYVGSVVLNLSFTPPVQPPVILSHPTNRSVQDGGSTSFSVSASGTGPITYQWQIARTGGETWVNLANDGTYSGTTSSTISIAGAGVTLATNGDRFRCVVSNAAGGVPSNEALLLVSPAPPSIVTYPQEKTIPVGGTATFSVVARGSGTLSYQWMRGSVDIAGATQSTLTITGATEAQAGSYSVRVTSAYGSTTSWSVQLYVVVPPTISTQPSDVAVALGYPFSLSVGFTWSSGLVVQWTRNGVDIPGATNSYLNISSASASDAGVYTVRLTNVAGSVVSQAATVVVLPRPPPENVRIRSSYGYESSNNIGLSVEVLSTWGTPLSYQWYLNGEAIAGATQASYSVTNPAPANYGDYFVTVTNPAGTGVSNVLTLTRPTPTSITGAWISAREVDGVVYFLFADTPRIARYSLATQTWLTSWTLPQTPTAFDFAGDSIYVGYTSDIVRYDRNLAAPFTLASAPGTIRGLVVAGDNLMVISSASYYDLQYRSYQRYSGLLINSTTRTYGPSVGLVYSAAARKFFARDSGLSPSDVYAVGLTDEGTIGSFLSSPYHGDYLSGSMLKVSADGQLLFENSGVVYSTENLEFKAAMGGPYQELVFQPEGGFLVLRSGRVSLLDSSYREMGFANFTGYPQKIAASDNWVFGFTPPLLVGQNPTVQLVAKSALQEPALAPVIAPEGRAVWDAKLMMDATGVVYVYSKLDRNIFRWSALEGRFLPSLPLRYGTDQIVYHQNSHAFYYIRHGASIRRVLIGSAGVTDTGFYSAPQTIRGMQATGNSLMFVDDTGAWSSHSTVSMTGTRLDWSDWNYYSREYTWSQANQRLYFFRDDTSPNDLLYEAIDRGGKIAYEVDSPYHGEVSTELPIRLASDGSQVILGSGQVFDAHTLKLQGRLNMKVMDAVAFGGTIYVLSASAAGSEISEFAASDLSLRRRQTFSGMPLRVFEAPGQRLVLITSNAGVPQFRLLASTDLTEISPANFSGAPQIVKQPVSVSTVAGSPTVFTVAATGAPSLRYQWTKDAVPLAGATNSTLVIPALSASDLGTYRVIVANDVGSTTSQSAVLKLETLPVISAQPMALTALVGQPAELSVTVDDPASASYQWYRNNNAISGANGSTYRIPSVTRDDGGSYTVEVSNLIGVVKSAAAVLTVVESPRVEWISPAQALYVGEYLNIYVNYRGTPSPSIQWYRNGQLIPGATGSSLTRSVVQLADAGDYTAVLTNPYGTLTSPVVSVKVTEIPGASLLSVSDAHSLFAVGDGVVWGHGDRSNYALGTSYSSAQLVPAVIFRDAVGVVAGNGNSIFIKPDGTVWAQGYGSSGKFGQVSGNTFSSPAQIGSSAKAVANGGTHLLLLKTDGTVWGRGNNDNGQIGDGIAGSRAEWTQLGSGTVAVAAGDHTSWFLRADGQLWATGALEYTGLPGSSGGTIRRAPELIADQVAQVVAGGVTFAFIKRDGSLWTLGRNDLGQLGDGTMTSRFVPAQVATGVRRVATSSRYALFVKEDDSLWGMGDVPFLPESGVAPADRTRPYRLATGVAQIAAGATHALFSTMDGRVYAGGSNALGQLGDGTTLLRTTPVLIWSRTLAAPAAPVWKPAEDGEAKTVALDWQPVVGASGYEIYRSRVNDPATAQLIGRVSSNALFFDEILDADIGTDFFYWLKAVNSAGASGFSPVVTRSRLLILRPVITQHPVSRTVVVGSAVTFTVAATGTPTPTYQWQRLPAGGTVWENIPATLPADYTGVDTPTLTLSGTRVLLSNSGDRFRCVASNLSGSETSEVATLQVGYAGFSKVVVGRYHSLRLNFVGQLHAAGANTHGQLGDGTTTNAPTAKVITIPGESIVDAAAGPQHTLLLTASKRLYATGNNTTGQLGDGTLVAKSTPILLATDVAAMAAGFFHNAYVKTDGTLWTVGGNDSGQLGTGDTTNRLTPVQIATDVVDVSAGIRQTLFIKTDGTLWIVGNRDGSDNFISTAVQIATGVRGVSAGGYHALFLKQDTTLWSVGYNASGQLADGTMVTRLTPQQIATGVRAFSAGYFHSAFVKTDHTLWTAGLNGFGQLGHGGTANQATPAQAATEVVAVSASEGFTLFSKRNGSLWGAGLNSNGQFGNGGSVTPASAVEISPGFFTIPDAPAQFTANSTGSSSRVRLLWHPAADAGTYEVWRGAANNSAAATLLASGLRWAYFEDTDAGSGADFYWVKAVNPAGTSAFSTVANAAGVPVQPPQITTQPASQSANVGGSVSFTVVATGDAPLSYQWRRGDSDLPTATSATLTLNPLLYDDRGDYRVVVTNTAGSVTSDIAVLSVNKLAQTITFASPAGRAFTATPFALSATASSGLPVSFTLVNGPATLASNTLTLAGPGTVIVRAEQAGDATYAAAAAIERSFVVTANFTSWQNARFTGAELLDSAISGSNADPDGDGLSNFLEYALGHEPRTATTADLPEVGATANAWTYTYTRPADRAALTYVVETSTDLVTWTTSNVTHELVSTTEGREMWRASLPLTMANAYFRLKVTQP